MVVHGPYPPDERVAREIAAAYAHGYDVDVVAMRRAGQPACETVEGAQVFRLPAARHRGAGALTVAVEYVGFTFLAAFHVARLARRRRYSVIQIHNPPDFLILAALIPRLRGAKVILDIHDFSSDMFAMRFGILRGARFADALLRAIERAATAFAHAVLTVHEPYRRELIARGVPADKITVVMNSLDERRLPQSRSEPEDGRFRIVYHGTITPHYGVDLLVEAVARAHDQLPNPVVEVYGEGDALPRIKQRVRELGLSQLFEFSDTYLPQAEVLCRVASARVGVITNRPTSLNRFALSTKLLEYVALGIPAVCSDLPTIREHFSESEVVFFKAGDADSLAAALIAVARDPESARERSRMALVRYEHYRWPDQATKYVAVLDQLSTNQRIDPPTLSDEREGA